MLKEEYKVYQEKMKKSIESVISDFDAVRAGRANSAVLNRIFAALYQDARAAGSSRDRLYRAMRYIERTHLKQEFSLQQAAREACCSEPYFRQLFRQRYGVSPKQYVIRLRMQHAASLIRAGYHSLQEVAARCGYADYKHFSVEFKRIMGVSPSQYTG